MKSIEELRSTVDDLEAEAIELADADELTEEQEARLDEVLAELPDARDKVAKAEQRAAKVEELRVAATKPGNVDHEIQAPNVNVRTSDPFDLSELRGASPERRTAEVRARAQTVAESDPTWEHLTDEAREALTARIGNKRSKVSGEIAELVLATGTEAYRDAFEAAIANPGSIQPRIEMERMLDQMSPESRTAIQSAGVSGALHVPYALDPTVILTNSGTINPVRMISRNVTITGTDTWAANTSAGVTAAVLGESTQVADNTPSFSSTTIKVYKQAAWAFGSFEALSDSGAGAELAGMFADARNRLESQLFTTGTGSSQPQGVVVFASNATSVYAGTSGDANAADLIAADIYGVRADLSPRWRPNAAWVANLATAHSIRQLGTTNNYHAFSLDLTQADSSLNLLGRPFYECSDMDSTIVSGSTDFVLLHGDFSQFVVVDRVGMTILYEPLVKSTGNNRPTGEAGWFAFWRSGSGGLVQDAFRLLKL